MSFACPGLAVSRMIVWRDHVKRHDKVVISLKMNQGRRPSKRKGSPPVPAVVANFDACLTFFCVSIYLHAYDRDKMGGGISYRNEPYKARFQFPG